jgi:signal transduction histidine kinase
MHSFRWRLLIGALLAGFGVFVLSPLVAFVLAQQHVIRLHMLHMLLMAITGIGAILAGIWHVRRSLSPFDQLRERLKDVKDGRASRLEGRYPSEVQPLANELNAFLEHREKVVAQAIAKAGDLAHGLKTPLAIVSREAERAAASGQEDLASVLTQQLERMRRHVEYHLAQARAAASGVNSRARTSVRESAEGLIRALQRLYADRNLQFEVDVSPDDCVRVEREDLDEMLGNLLDNACKWTRSRIIVHSSRDAITVDDDGPGIPPSLRTAVLERGVRADEAAPGSGLGLAIVRELAELYGGSVTLEQAPAGGLRARLKLPAAS